MYFLNRKSVMTCMVVETMEIWAWTVVHLEDEEATEVAHQKEGNALFILAVVVSTPLLSRANIGSMLRIAIFLPHSFSSPANRVWSWEWIVLWFTELFDSNSAGERCYSHYCLRGSSCKLFFCLLETDCRTVNSDPECWLTSSCPTTLTPGPMRHLAEH